MPAQTTRPLMTAFQRTAQADLVEQICALPFQPSIRAAIIDGFADGYRAAQRDLLAAGILVLDPDHDHAARGEDEGECEVCALTSDQIAEADKRIEAAKAAATKRGRR